MIDCEAYKNHNKKFQVKRIQSAFNLKPQPVQNSNKDSFAHFTNNLTAKVKSNT